MTTATATEVLEFLESTKDIVIDRREIASASFGVIRRNIRRIVVNLSDSDDEEALRIARELRTTLSEWLTVPVAFDNSVSESLASVLGAPDAVQARWGKEIRSYYDLCRESAQDIQREENPVRIQLRTVTEELRAQQREFKIYCHPRSIDHYQALLVEAGCEQLATEIFICTLKAYNETSPFDVLIKVGPLRVRGWGSAPDALVSSPRFKKLVHMVWAGCSNDTDFGYDPVESMHGTLAKDGEESGHEGHSIHRKLNFNTHTSRYGEDPGADADSESNSDELRIFRNLEQSAESRPATLVQVEDSHGILYPPHSRVLSFDCDSTAQSPIMFRIPGDSLVEGMYAIVPDVDDIDLGGLQAERGHFSEIWKARLKALYSADPAKLMIRLRAEGLNLINLSSAIRHWCSPPTTVIHAPQQVKHFEILIKVLEVGDDSAIRVGSRTLPFWQVAWNEVRRSRGEAIQAGFQEQEIVEEELLNVLSQIVPDLRIKASEGAGFNIAIPPQHGIRGTFNFLRIEGIESGFRVPSNYFRVILDLRTVDQWRD